MTKRIAQVLAVVVAAGILGAILARPTQKPAANWAPDPQPAAAVAPAQQPAPAAPHEVVTPLEAALRKGRLENKPVVLFFTTPGCVPCQAMKRDVFSDPSVKRVLDANYVFLTVDSAEDPDTVAMYKVTAFPTNIVLSNTGQMQQVYIGPLSAVTYTAWLRNEFPETRKGGILKR
jgi:thiol:disulfide interchange protein